MKLLETLRAIPPKKWWIIGISAGCALLVLLGCLFLLPGGSTPAGGKVNPGDKATVTVTNRVGNPLEGVQVYIYEDKSLSELVSFAKTDASGKVTYVAGEKNYVAVLKGLAAGYQAEEYYVLKGADTAIVLDALAKAEGDALPTNVKFSLGDPVMDFTFTDVDGNNYTISEVLKEKKALVLNFWFINCDPCAMEFPYLQAAYDKYKDDVALLAVNCYPGDDAEGIKAYQAENGLTMPMADADSAWSSLMNLTAYPTTVVIDRYGFITYRHVGSITDEGVFERLFAYYGADNYQQVITDDVDKLDVVITDDGEVIVGTDDGTDGEGTTDSTTPGQNGNNGATGNHPAGNLPGDNTGATAATTTVLNEDLRTHFPNLGTKDAPNEVGSTLVFTADIPAGKESYFNVFRVGGTILTVHSNTLQVDYKGKTYSPNNGKIEIPVQTDDVTIPISLILRNTGSAKETFTVNFVYPGGTLANPFTLKMGKLTTNIAKGNDQGVVYVYTATVDGTLTITEGSATKGVNYDFVLYNLSTYSYLTLDQEGTGSAGKRSLSIKVAKGQTVQVTISTLPDDKNEYPAATIESNLSFVEAATTAPTTTTTLPSHQTFTVTVKDNYGAAMSGVELTFTVGSDSKKVKTNGSGVASAQMTYGDCQVKVAMPDGYFADTDKYTIKVGSPALTIVLEYDDWFGGDVEEPTTTPTTEPTTKPTTAPTTEPTTKPTTQPTTPTGTTSGTATGTTTPSTEPTTQPTEPSTAPTTEPTTKPTTAPTTSPYLTYTVKLVDDSGAAVSGAAVKIATTSGSVQAEGVSDANGIFRAELLRGNYRVMVSGTTLKYDERAAVMTAAKPSVTVLMAEVLDDTQLEIVRCPVQSTDEEDVEMDAYYVEEGATYVPLEKGVRNYFLFNPIRDGVYRITATNSSAKVGYYGGSIHFFMAFHIGEEVANNAFNVTVRESNIGATYVLGIDAPTNISNTILNITRVGDPGWTVDEEPWVDFVGEHTPTKYTLPAGTELIDMDVTAAGYNLVFNETDGCYHLNTADGPLVYVRFAKSSYLNFTEIFNNVRVGAYLYDANGQFLMKEDYTAYLRQYYYVPNSMYDPDGKVVNMLSSSVYPLNKDLEYILKIYGEQKGWWNPESPDYQFADVEGVVNTDIAWMFLLCYADN